MLCRNNVVIYLSFKRLNKGSKGVILVCLVQSEERRMYKEGEHCSALASEGQEGRHFSEVADTDLWGRVSKEVASTTVHGYVLSASTAKLVQFQHVRCVDTSHNDKWGGADRI